MSAPRPRRLRAAALSLALAAVVAPAAMAHEIVLTSDGGSRPGSDERDTHQHGANDGHLGATSSGVELISKLALKNIEPGKIADVGVSPDGNTAFLAAWGGETCKYNGVHVVDIADPKAPKEVSFIVSKEGSYPGEGVQSLRISTPAFTGDVLVTNNEKCKDKAGFGGMNLYDVTRPGSPTPLAEGVGDSVATPGQGKKDANDIHSVYAWDADDKAYAVIVDNEEGPDVDIMDITDPRKAKLIAEYDLDEMFPQILQAAPENLVEVFLHDMIVKEIDGRQIMLASYWDGGYVKLDVTNPLMPAYLGDTDFTNPDPELAQSAIVAPPEGNAHQAEFTKDNRYVIGADEDFGPFALKAANVDDATKLTASQGSDTTPLREGSMITGQTKFVGRACPGDPTVVGGDGTQIAVVERGVCSFTEKVTSVTQAGGYAAVLVVNRTGSDACNQSLGMSVEGSVPTFGVAPRQQGLAIFDLEGNYDDAACNADTTGAQLPIAMGTTGDTLTFSSYFDGWGYVHLYDNSDGKMAELDTYALDQAHDPMFATGFGDLSVHEVATSKREADLAYFSYYAGGFRVTRIENGQLVEKGRYIEEGGSNLWGVEVFEDRGRELVVASDRDGGLRILRYTGD